MGIETPNDVGTRFRHYSELKDVWEAGLAVIKGRPYHSDLDKKRITEMEEALAFLGRHIDFMVGFEPGVYSDALFRLKRRIDAIPAEVAGMGEDGYGAV